MRRVLAIDDCGKVMFRFASVTEAAASVGVHSSWLQKLIKRHEPRDGYLYVYEDEEDLAHLEEEARKERRREQARIRYEEQRLSGNSEREDLNEFEFEVEVKLWTERGVELERVKYDTNHGVVSKTPCLKMEYEHRPLVGSMRCTMCRYFRGKNKQSHEVLCAHRYYQKKAAMDQRGRSKKK